MCECNTCTMEDGSVEGIFWCCCYDCCCCFFSFLSISFYFSSRLRQVLPRVLNYKIPKTNKEREQESRQQMIVRHHEACTSVAIYTHTHTHTLTHTSSQSTAPHPPSLIRSFVLIFFPYYSFIIIILWNFVWSLLSIGVMGVVLKGRRFYCNHFGCLPLAWNSSN